MASKPELIQAFRTQAHACGELASPFMEGLLNRAAKEIQHSGSISGVLGAWPGDPARDAVPLRFAAALHALALSKTDPTLASAYDRVGIATEQDAIWSAVLSAIKAHQPFVERFFRSPPQTNEVRRAAVLLGGFLEIARAANRIPMRILEIGASAGLNLFWDRYHYDLSGRAQWGETNSPVQIAATWDGPLPPLQAPIRVAERAASDVEPVDLEDPQARLRLRAYVWADRHDRMDLLNAAIAFVRRQKPRVEKAEASDWVAQQLARPTEGHITVLYHSIAWPYFPEKTQRNIQAAMDVAGRQARPDAPLAWLRLEPPDDNGPGEGQLRLRLTVWPGGRDQCLARAHTHGPPVIWLAKESADDQKSGGRIQVLHRQILSDNWYRLEKVRFEYTRQENARQMLEREVYHNGPGAAVLPIDRMRGAVLLVRQFRIPAYLNGDPGMLIEACAGNVEEADEPSETARKEAAQELGYRVRNLRQVFALYTSPGASAEKLYLFVADYSPADRLGEGGGERGEGEETEILELPLSRAWDMVRSGAIVDAKTVLLLQYALSGE